MIYTLENEHLKIAANTHGGELYSLYSKKTKTEYLWQGDPAFWKDRALNLFPFIGRNYEGKYYYEGQEYTSRAHGLCRYFEFVLESQTKNSLTFLLQDNEDTRKEYPFAFAFRVTFTLQGTTLTTAYEVENKDKRTLICSFGGHPGINIPFEGGTFEDYYLEFDEPREARRQLLYGNTPYMADESPLYPLVDGVKLPLRHDLFLLDAVILENTSKCVSIKSTKSSRYVTMRFEDFPFLGVWQINEPDAPYVCLEPWSALPALYGKPVDLETKPHMTHVPKGTRAGKSFTLEIHE